MSSRPNPGGLIEPVQKLKNRKRWHVEVSMACAMRAAV